MAGFRVRGSKSLPEGTQARLWTALESGMSPTPAATVAGVSGATGRKWAQRAGYVRDPEHCGVRYSQAVRDGFWQSMHAGAGVAEAAMAAGVSENAARAWVDQAGFVPRTPMPIPCVVALDPRSFDKLIGFIEGC